MTRQQIAARALGLAGIRPGQPGSEDPITLDADIDARANQLLRASNGCWLEYTVDVEAGQPFYCAPGLYEIHRVSITTPGQMGNPSSKRQDLAPVLPDDLAALCPAYRIETAAGVPEYAVTLGAGEIELYPTPNYNAAGTEQAPEIGLTIAGFGLEIGTWPARSAKCPLPEVHHDSIAYGVAADAGRRAAIEATRAGDPVLAAALRSLAAENEARFRYLKGHFESDAGRFTQAARHRSALAGARIPSGPLDL